MISDNGDESMNIRTISLPNFEVSWAGVSPGRPGYWFGSDDGRVQFISLDGDRVDRPLCNRAVGGGRQRDCVRRRSHGCEHPERCHLPESTRARMRATSRGPFSRGSPWCGQYARRLHHRSDGPAGNPAHGPETGDGPEGENPQARR